ncbi:hypothetical protein CC80DRAFT_585978 [Byssothecium circinans]|uniref:Uncharacterized protein n=1 Tax=Byssothecium circinans TaxID=147558 RepID=A0A6A5U3E5_9PLEO|nr:hypothetical protein CC80DRAFT_585978 [Byssothecium circinans]
MIRLKRGAVPGMEWLVMDGGRVAEWAEWAEAERAGTGGRYPWDAGETGGCAPIRRPGRGRAVMHASHHERGDDWLRRAGHAWRWLPVVQHTSGANNQAKESARRPARHWQYSSALPSCLPVPTCCPSPVKLPRFHAFRPSPSRLAPGGELSSIWSGAASRSHSLARQRRLSIPSLDYSQ